MRINLHVCDYRQQGSHYIHVHVPNELQGGGDHQEENNGDDMTGDTSSRHKAYSDWIL